MFFLLTLPCELLKKAYRIQRQLVPLNMNYTV